MLTNANMHHSWYKDHLFLFGDVDDVGKLEWQYDPAHEELKVKVEFTVEELFGKDTDVVFTDVDTSLLEETLKMLGADSIEIARFEVKDGEIKLELRGHGVDVTEEQIAEALQVLSLGITAEDGSGNEISTALYLGGDPSLMDALVQTDLTDVMEGYVQHHDMLALGDLAAYAPTTSQAIIDNFHDYNTDRCVPDKLVMTEDVWFAEAAADYRLCKTDDALSKMEWDYSRGGERLTLQVEFKLEGLFGADHTEFVSDLDASSVEQLMSNLGASLIEISKLELKDDRVILEIKGEGISITDEEVYALPESVSLGLKVDDGAGNLSAADLDLCVLKYDPHSPVSFDLNFDGQIGTTGVSTAQTRADMQVGTTVEFDIDGDGIVDEIEWLSGDGDALLVDNRDGNAMTQMDGTRLFGDEGGKYVNGYQKMSMLLDTDQDGVLVGAELDGLQLWIDDGDAVAEFGEFVDVQMYGISEIGTGYYLPENDRGETLMRSWAVIEGCDGAPPPPLGEPDLGFMPEPEDPSLNF